MNTKISLSLFVASILGIGLIGCGGGSSDNNSTSTPTSNTIPSTKGSSDTSTVSFSGVAVDGYISGATACIDTNVNGKCDTTEPTTTTSADGTFSFSNVKIADAKLLPVIVIGGTDTATGKAFKGELKNIVDSSTINAGTVMNITPLTDLVATSFIASPTKDTIALQQSKSSVASSLGLTADKVDADPMKDKEVFAKAMVVRQTKELLLSTSIKAKGVASGSSDADRLRKTVTQAIVASMQDNDLNELNTTQIISKLETIDAKVVIPENEKEFLEAQVSEINTALDTLVNDVTVDMTILIQTQVNLENQVDTAKTTIADATDNSTLVVVPAKIEPQPVTSPLRTPPTPPTL